MTLLFLLVSSLCFDGIFSKLVKFDKFVYTEGDNIDIPIQNRTRITGRYKNYTEMWSFVWTGSCKTLEKRYICENVRECFDDLVIGNGCDYHNHIDLPLGVAYFRVNGNGSLNLLEDVYFTNGTDILPIMTTTGRGLRINNATVGHTGIYTLSYRFGSGDWFSFHVFLVVKKKTDVKPTTNPKFTKYTTAIVTRPPLAPNIHGAEFISKNYHTQLFSAGDSFTTTTFLKWAIHDSSFNITVSWFFLPINTWCSMYKVYEICLYHSNETSCRNPAEGPNCVFTSPENAKEVATRQYINCKDNDNWTKTCTKIESIDRDHKYLTMVNETINLCFSNTPESASGLYVMLLKYNGRIETWTYTMISTSSLFRSVVEYFDAPESPHEPFDKNVITTEATPKPTPEPEIRSKVIIICVLGIGGVCIIGLIVTTIWGIIKCIRTRRKPYQLVNAYSHIYRELPVNDQFMDDDESDSFEDDSEESGDERPNIPTSPLPPPPPPLPPKKGSSGFRVWFADEKSPNYKDLAERVGSILNE
ncbi:envelope glycoprotein E [Spheniscid alphaherpesvirus 1]|uniref:Envelope glycoprotein E n=1 Tax=Spheniscid alphaherpesvirus 1 TaxID=2560777 RepID=A0A1R3T8D7_9ALPH|nr:envelope glycoprotein E [Spheniscid alphaherpesvirus 1]